jgi:hypothetical protein
MLTCKDVICSKNDKKKIIFYEPFVQTYFEYSKDDATEEKESKNLSVEDDGTQKVYNSLKKQVPVGVSKSDPEDLLAEALSFFQEKYPKPGEGLLNLLSHVSAGYNLEQRKDAAPTKEKPAIAPDKAVNKAAEALVRGGMFASLAEATEFINSRPVKTATA